MTSILQYWKYLIFIEYGFDFLKKAVAAKKGIFSIMWHKEKINSIHVDVQCKPNVQKVPIIRISYLSIINSFVFINLLVLWDC